MAALAQTPTGRITREIDNFTRIVIPGSHSPLARTEDDAGRVPPGTGLQGITLVFRRTAAQEADLQALIAAPEEFAARFGVAASDVAKITSWLEQQGFWVDGVSRSKNHVTFSGMVRQVETAFGAEIHYYNVNGKTHFAPSADISIPAALSSLVQTVGNLSTFRPKPHVRLGRSATAPRPLFTSSQTGSHFLSPKDIAVIYDINPAYNAGYFGTNQAIAVVGQSEIELSDIENFQSAAGLPTKAPTMILVPNSGTAAFSSGDEAESDLDLEYSGGIAKGATIYFVYVGDSRNYSVWDSIHYAVENQVAPVISTSYGLCEAALGSSEYSSLNATLEQAASQGQSVIAAAGDDGSTDCHGTLNGSKGEALAVDFPASSQYVTGMGGTEFPAADVASTNTTYWESASSGSDVIPSALSYIPEVVWNDDSSTEDIVSGGGGISSMTPRPAWQTGVPGIPSGSYRLVPDISLDASAENAPYLICSSDSAWTGVTGSCSHGFRDSNGVYLTVAGGTSFCGPIFAGMLAIINEKLNSTGQGVVNSTLYTLAADSTTYASAFHDITQGGNQCTAGSTDCSSTSGGESEYLATTGYDGASGLGSLDFYNLLMAWPTPPSSSLTPSRTTLSAQTTSPAAGVTDTITITVAPVSSSSTPTPTGTLTIVVDGTTETSSLALTNGSATYPFSSTTTGLHVILATYSGNSTYSSSIGALTVTVGANPVATPAPGIASLSPAVVYAGSSAFTLTVTGSNFGEGATVLWNGSSLSTTWVSTTQLTASIPATDIASAGIVDITVASLGGGVSSTFDFVIDTATGATGAFTVSSKITTLNVQPGHPITLPVTFTGAASGAVITFSGCYNQPAGVFCSYSNGVITITTSASTPARAYDDVIVVFTSTQQTAAVPRSRQIYLATWFGFTGMPLGFLWMGIGRKKVLCRCLILLFGLLLMLPLANCGGGGPSSQPTSTTTSTTTTTTTQSSIVLTLNVQNS
jgi:hypothetical protein